MKTVYEVHVYDSTCNDLAHDFGVYGKGDYSWAFGRLNGGNTDLSPMTKAEAEDVKEDFLQYIEENDLWWASVDIMELEV